MPDSPKPSPRPPDDTAPLKRTQTPVELVALEMPATNRFVLERTTEAGLRPAFVPSRKMPLIVAVLVGAAASAVPLLAVETVSLRVVLAAALGGAASTAATFFGMSSAGVQRR